MHHGLTVAEIVDQITSHCDSPSLLSLARAARLFDCALDRLWTDVSHTVLLKCFSSEVVECSREGYRHLVTLLNQPEPRHWERFHFYAKRVKTLLLWPDDFDEELIDVLCLHAPPGGLLPRLRTCRLRIAKLSHLRLLQPFTSPLLKELYVTFYTSPEFLQDAVSTSSFASLPNLCPKLTSLSLEWSEGGRFPDIPAFLRSFQDLKELDMDEVEVTDFPVIASLPQLSSLKLRCLAHNATRHPEPPTDMCRALRYLHVTSPINSIRTLFLYLSNCPIEDIRFAITDATWIGLDEVLLLVREKCERNTLRGMEINIARQEPTNGPLLNGDSLSPLFDFPNIAEFRFPFCMFAVSDRHILMLAQRWPKLVYLDVINDGFPSPVPDAMSLTIKSLSSLVRYCPLLRHLCIVFDALNVDFDPESPPADGTCNRLVTELDVGASPISQAPSVAGYLSSLFPGLQKIYWEYQLENTALWGDVRSILIASIQLRQQEPLREGRVAASGS